jgi:threonine dehydratase
MLSEKMQAIDVDAAADQLKSLITRTPLIYHKRLSAQYECNVYIKREDLQPVRSYKLRGAFNKIISLTEEQRQKGVACASAGNHAQGVAYSCNFLRIPAHIFMPANTPSQKIERVKALGGPYVSINLTGDTYDEAAEAATAFAIANQVQLIPPFDDIKVIEGQATIAKEILEDAALWSSAESIDYLFLPVGGGGLAAGVSTYFKQHSPATQLIGAEPAGAASMTAAFDNDRPFQLEKIYPFVDGAAVRQVGNITFQFCKEAGLQMTTVVEGKVCSALLRLYNEDGMLAEPAGALSIAALDNYADEIKGKNIVCILSGSNNDSNRMEEIKKLADAWEGLQHHLIVRFTHNPDGLKTFFTEILTEDDYVNRIEYMRRDHGRSTYALLGLRCKNEEGYNSILQKLNGHNIEYKEVKKEDFLFKYWV